MKSCFGTLCVLLLILAVLGTGGLIWYLSSNTEFSRKESSGFSVPADRSAE